MVKRRTEVPTQTCKSCTYCTHKYCMVFRRPVDTVFNKCWKHSIYEPQAQPFKVDNRLEIIMKAEEQQAKKHYKGYLAEDNKIRKLIQADIEKEKQRKQA